METCCGYGYEPARHLPWPSPGFSRSEGKIRTPPQLRCSSRSKPYLPARGFHGTRALMQKRKLFPDLPTASPGHFGLPRRTLFRGPDLITVPLPGSGIGTGFPFARRVCASLCTYGDGVLADTTDKTSALCANIAAATQYDALLPYVCALLL